MKKPDKVCLQELNEFFNVDKPFLTFKKSNYTYKGFDQGDVTICIYKVKNSFEYYFKFERHEYYYDLSDSDNNAGVALMICITSHILSEYSQSQSFLSDLILTLQEEEL